MLNVNTRQPRSHVSGVLLLDKPTGLTSNGSLQIAKRLLNAIKAGHCGNLDPIATGLLPLFFGEATKLTQFLLNADKRYWAEIQLGTSTTTFDSEGKITVTRPVTADLNVINQAIQDFIGEIDQVPPMFSAIKQNGQALYKLARKGLEVTRKSRRVTVNEIKILGFQNNRLALEISCSKGMYVRTLAHDLGEVLGCGAHVVNLRRIAIGSISINQAITLDKIEAMDTPSERVNLLQPVDEVLKTVPEVRLTSLAVHYLKQGQAVTARHQVASGWVRLYEQNDRFLGMGQVLDDGRVAPRRLLGLGETP